MSAHKITTTPLEAPRPCEDCARPVVYCDRCENWEHAEEGRSCFLSPAPCEDQRSAEEVTR